MQTPKSGNSKNSISEEIAEIKKVEFVQFVEALVKLRELQYASEVGNHVIERAQKIMALNLPSNLVRAAAIFVDHAYGFPSGHGTFHPPEWVLAKSLLPEKDRGSLRCTFREDYPLEEEEVVILLKDLPEDGLHAGMACIIREVPSEEDDKTYLVEFGEPQKSASIEIEISGEIIRRPRPGDLLEDYRR